MKVGELIKILQAFDENLEVVAELYDKTTVQIEGAEIVEGVQFSTLTGRTIYTKRLVLLERWGFGSNDDL